MRADHHDPEQLAVPALVDRLDPSRRLVLHHGAGAGDPGAHPELDVVALLLAGLLLGGPAARDPRARVKRAREGAVEDHGLMAHRALSVNLARAEVGERELLVTGAVACRV